MHSYGLREENDSLRWQLDAYRNEVELLKEQGKMQHPEEDSHEHQLNFLQQTMHSMQQVAHFTKQPYTVQIINIVLTALEHLPGPE